MSSSEQIIASIAERMKSLTGDVSSIITMMAGDKFDPDDLGFKGRLKQVEADIKEVTDAIDVDKLKALSRVNTKKLFSLLSLDIKQLEVAIKFHENIDEAALETLVANKKEKKGNMSKLKMGVIQAVIIFLLIGFMTFFWGLVQDHFLNEAADRLEARTPTPELVLPADTSLTGSNGGN
jgi:hypothetical protein